MGEWQLSFWLNELLVMVRCSYVQSEKIHFTAYRCFRIPLFKMTMSMTSGEAEFLCFPHLVNQTMFIQKSWRYACLKWKMDEIHERTGSLYMRVSDITKTRSHFNGLYARFGHDHCLASGNSYTHGEYHCYNKRLCRLWWVMNQRCVSKDSTDSTSTLKLHVRK